MENKREEIMSQALSIAQNYKRCTMAISQGVGKTLLGLKDMDMRLTVNKDAKFLIIVPKLSVIDTWKKECVKFNKEYLINKLTFVTYRSLNKYSDIANEFLSIYFDEIHNIKYSHKIFLDKYRGRILGLTGSPPKRKNSEKHNMISSYAPIVFKYITDEAIDDKILNNYRIYCHPVLLSRENDIMMNKKNGGYFYTSELKQYNYYNNLINKYPENFKLRLLMSTQLLKFKSKEVKVKQLLNLIKDKTLIFANDTAQANRLSKHVYHSKNNNNQENLELFKNGDIQVLASVDQLKEGINIPNLKASIIIHSYASEYVTSQRIGRCLRLPVNETAIIHILYYIGTIDEKWVKKALSGYDKNKITWLDL